MTLAVVIVRCSLDDDSPLLSLDDGPLMEIAYVYDDWSPDHDDDVLMVAMDDDGFGALALDWWSS